MQISTVIVVTLGIWALMLADPLAKMMALAMLILLLRIWRWREETWKWK